ncbi:MULTISPECIES: hypothetical protein [unclassified Roseobacter]|nr:MULTISPECIES: hypothetical protein [unclassified Roseobacter]NNX35137.1 hypothetical protein [Roseobacter sp. HKCCD8418]NNY29147.1 hypothetical protein [Roseobacter sp. HKCCD9199]NNY42028.1 hypothetical protein [Roseobacter sp. HKCCD8831]NNY59107.1 hypothetical protein [Roseobacter sp. HKCCD6795]NNZ68917.1 hypothetical protein [Roseobacter sp. HKCCD6544]NOA83575.1 hypothetical protein [Roseobacter sp. HKCCD8733]NOA92083.1 hypothetical protein [Roseobacter sp. HKCCD7561]NOB38945.1 hypothe
MSNFVVIFILFNLAASQFYYWSDIGDFHRYPYIDNRFSDEILGTFNSNLVWLCYIALGHIIFSASYNAAPKIKFTRGGYSQRTRRINTDLISVIVVLIALLFALYYQDALISRQSYIIEGENTQIRTLLMLLVVISAFLTGVVARDRPTLGLVLLIIIIVLLLAHGSRRAAVAPALFFLGKYLSDTPSVKNYVSLTVTSGCLLAFSLLMRNMDQQGLAHFFNVFNFDNLDALPISNLFQYVLNNLFMGFPMAHYAKSNIAIDSHIIFASLNPLPGALVWRHEYTDLLRVGTFFPVNAIGTLNGAEHMAGAFAATFFGFLLSIVNLQYLQAVARQQRVVMIAILGLSLLASIFFVQYGLRHAVRPLYYAIFIGLAVNSFRSLLPRDQTKT